MAIKKKLSKNKKVIIGVVVGLLVLAASGFGVYKTFFIKEETKNKNEVKEKAPVQKQEEVEKKLEIVDVNSKSRPYAVMINNISTARPYQSGLQDAYLIYEIIVEGGITRYLALFKDQTTERIGSVRSARHYYLDYVLENDAYYVHWGWSPQAQSDIKSLKINNINGLTYEGKYFWRDKTLKVSSEHTGFTNIEKLSAAVDKLNYRTETNKDLLLNYSIEKIDLSKRDDAIKADNVHITYSKSIKSSYVYDSENEYYLRSINNKEHKDYVTKEQYHFKNIITYKVDNSTVSGDNKGRQNLDNIGSGTGYYITNGYAIPIKWEKTSRGAQTKYTYTDGTEIKVNDGNTFIQIQPDGQTLEIN